MTKTILQLIDEIGQVQQENATIRQKIVQEKKHGVALSEDLAQFDDIARAEDEFTAEFK